nr:uncharacterized protein LOC104647500 [Solanum lycopersicum]
MVDKFLKQKHGSEVIKEIWNKLKALQPVLRQLNGREFQYIGQKIEKTRSELVELQEQLYSQARDELVAKEKELLINMEKWSMIEESALRQKARARWIKLGDANNKYFSSVIKERTQKKHIRSILYIYGRMLYELQEIQQEFVMFYKSLMGSSAGKLPAINAQVMKRGPVLSKQQRIQLRTGIIEYEIYTTLQSIGNDKPPGIDGYNAHFFKHSWKIIKKDVIEAVKSFFTTGKLFKPFNCTLVSLIPKVQSPKTVKEYRPIACCTVLYKIISKVITKRMHEVIHTVICESHAGVIPGRKIADNIIMAYELVKAYTRRNISPRSMLNIDLQKAYDSVEWPFLEQVMANLTKSSIYCGGVQMEVRQQIIQQLGYTMEELPFKYLGVPLSTKKLTIIQCHTGSTFIIPAKIIKVIEGLCRRGVDFVTKKALIAWEKVCCPKCEGGMGLINMKVWNRAAVAKLCWDLANKEDKLWIKWIHAYIIKGQREWKRTKHASWMKQKVMNAKKIVEQVQQVHGNSKGMIRQLYCHMKGDQQRPALTCIMFNNVARPKAYFTMWIMMNQRLATVDKLAQWGVVVEKICVLCKNADETVKHLFMQCNFARRMRGRLLSWIEQQSNVPMTCEQFLQWCIQEDPVYLAIGIKPEGLTRPLEELAGQEPATQKRLSIDEPQQSSALCAGPFYTPSAPPPQQ